MSNPPVDNIVIKLMELADAYTDAPEKPTRKVLQDELTRLVTYYVGVEAVLSELVKENE